MKRKYHTIGTVPKSNRKIVEIDTSNTDIHDRSISWLGIGSIVIAELQIKKNSCQTLGPASKRVLPDLPTFCQTYFFLEIF